MKYNENNKPIVCMMTQSTCYRGTTKMTPKGVLWHSTGANNPTLKRYVQPDDNAPDREEMLALIGKNLYNNDFNHIDRQAGLNAWIGKLASGEIASIQTMPWDFKPWGCGSGSKGSCNNGWMQFEICEDGLTDKNYFNAVYREACELTAYYCKMYNLDPKGTVKYNGVDVPVILDHKTSCDLKLGGNHGDVQHWFKKHGKTLDDVRNDVAALMAESAPAPSVPESTPQATPQPVEEMYRVRKSWTDSKSQIGAYRNLNYAKEACDKAGDEYKVYNSKGEQVYPESKTESTSKNEDNQVSQTAPSRPTLREGSRGQDVKFLQTKLASFGYKPGSVDGIFGPKTKKAVTLLQRDHLLVVDGICGPKTWQKIDDLSKT